jgi:superfamily II DNA or RNA helicase
MSADRATLTLDALRRRLGAVVVARGEAYVRQGRVLAHSLDAAGGLEARVQGGRRAPYALTARLVLDGRGGIGRIDSACDCPVGSGCKHVAAALIAALIEGRPGAPPASDDRLPADIGLWLQRLRAAQTPPPPATEYPDTVRDRLLYVLDAAATRRATVETIKINVKQDGALGRTIRPYDVVRHGVWDPPKFVLPVDLLLGRALYRIGLLKNSASGYGLEPLEGETLGVLTQIAETGRARWCDAHGPVLAPGAPRRGRFVWRAEADGRQRLVVEDASEGAEGGALIVLDADPPIYVDPETGALGRLDLPAPAAVVSVLLAAPAAQPEATEALADALAEIAPSVAPPPRRIRSEVRKGVTPRPLLRLFGLTAREKRYARGGPLGGKATLAALRLAFDYDGHRLATGTQGDIRFRDGEVAVTLRRDLMAEARADARLAEAGADRLDQLYEWSFGRDAEPGDRAFPLYDDDAALAADEDALRFAAETVPALRAEGWRVEIDASWPYRFHEGPVEIRAALDEGDGGWFSVGLSLIAGDQRLDLAPLLASIIACLPVTTEGLLEEDFDVEEFLEEVRLYRRLPDGALVTFDAATLAPLVRAFLQAQRLFDHAHPAEAGHVADLAEALEGCGVPFDGGQRLRALGERLRRLAAQPEAAPPPSLAAALRPYQKAGYGWLASLAETGFGGMLADDMGLGKTVQALALLAGRHLDGDADRPSLVIAPTSLVGVWRREAARFAPGLKVLALHGPDRRVRFGDIAEHHLVISTYPLLHRDIDSLAAQSWEVAILDEAQAVKNPAAAAAKHIRRLDARARLALTGTPVENSLQDLWALFDWLIPGLLGDRKAFRERFRTPIEKLGDAAAQAALNARIRPFLLRRTKAEVAADLPERTEIVETVPLPDRQRGLYESIRATMNARVRAAIAERGLAGSRITILDALLKLRQVCCDPRLLDRDGADAIESAKRARLMELLDELVAEGRKVLVFSQFVRMLRLIEDDLVARGHGYVWLTGDTKDREAVVAAFQAGAAPIFLISLRAGGVGLTLTAADTVILYDPWWNPAVERQAADRAHRIGQTRRVFVHRLVAEGSVEQTILAMQERKQGLADALFDPEAGGPLALDEADIDTLFRPMGP